jgi:hypothetical protein
MCSVTEQIAVNLLHEAYKWNLVLPQFGKTLNTV